MRDILIHFHKKRGFSNLQTAKTNCDDQLEALKQERLYKYYQTAFKRQKFAPRHNCENTLSKKQSKIRKKQMVEISKNIT